MGWIVRVVFFAVAFFVALACGVVWYAVASQASTQNTNQSGNANRVSTNVNASGGTDTAMSGNLSRGPETATTTSVVNAAVAETEASDGEPPTVSWSEEKDTPSGYITVPRLTLRKDPNPTAPAVVTLDTSQYDQPNIIRSTRDHLLITHGRADENGTIVGNYEGWVEWGEVMPYTNAIVLDASDGRVVARVPLGAGVSHAAFSPDGKRVLFYATFYDDGHGAASPAAYELETDGYQFVRSLKVSNGGWASLVYGDAEGELSALVQTVTYNQSSTATKLYPFKVGGQGGAPANSARVPQPGEITVSGDGRTGISIRGTHAETGATRLDVIDMLTLEVRSSFELLGSTGEGWPYERVLNRDGSELYYRADSETGTIAVVDTRTGQRLREIPLRVPKDQWSSFDAGGLAGDSLLVRFWREGNGHVEAESMAGDEIKDGEEAEHQHDEMATSKAFWVREDGTATPAERGIDQVLRVGEQLYAVDDAGTQLLKLDAEGRIVERFRIARPEVKHEAGAAETFNIMGLAASPDGRHIVIFFGIPDGC